MLDLPLENAQAKPIRYLLHIALSFNGGNPDLISMLINFGMDVNERYYPEAPLKYVYFYFAMKYRLLGPSRFRTICFLATIFRSILVGRVFWCEEFPGCPKRFGEYTTSTNQCEAV